MTARETANAQREFSAFDDCRTPGGFIVSSRHCVHSINTPRPYLHLMTGLHSRQRGTYGSFWDQTGRGFSCLDSVLAGPITSHLDTSYVPTVPSEPDYRAFYLREESRSGKTPDTWFLIPQPGRDEERYSDYRCVQEPGETTIAAASRGILGSVHTFVAHDDPLEIWTVSLRNMTGNRRRIALFSRLNWGLRSYPGHYFDMRVVCCGLCDSKLNAIAAFNNDKNNRHPRSGLMMSDIAPAGYDLSREIFDGNGVFREFPEAVIVGRCRNSTGRAPLAGMVGVLQHDLTLPPRSERAVRILVAAAPADHVAAARVRRVWRKRYFTESGTDKELRKIRKTWRARCESNMIRTRDDEMDRFFNVWSKVQASGQARFIRALDMAGYRDVLQDVMAVCDFDAPYARNAILRTLEYQLRDGRALRQYALFPNAPHDTRMYMDSAVWIPDTLTTYIKESGDISILDEPVGFFDPDTGTVDNSRPATVYRHALAAVQSCYDFRGRHGLCLAGHGDWNDALDGIGRGGKGVSTWLTLAVIYAAGIMRSLAVHIGRKTDARRMKDIETTLRDAVNRHAWDGAHYVYGYTDSGEPIGSARNGEGKTVLNVNTWALFTGVAASARPARTDRTLAAIARLKTPLGYRLLAPPYTAASRRVGRIADMLPGLFENGSIYTHGQAFAAWAFASLGMGDEAWETLKMTMPSRTLPALSTAPPHQQSNFTVGPDHEDYGMQYYTNFSGSLDWYRKTLARMAGVTADYDGLRIDPCIPRRLKEYSVSKLFRGARYNVTIRNPAGVNAGIAALQVDGRGIKGNLVPPSRKKICAVEAVLG